MDYFGDLWIAAKQAGPFASLVLLVVLYAVNAERKNWQSKYEVLVGRFISLAGDTTATLKDWRDVFQHAQDHQR